MKVFLHNSPFATAERVFQQRHRLPAPPPDQRHGRADPPRRAALRRIYRPGPHYAKCGVMLTELGAGRHRPGRSVRHARQPAAVA